MSKIDTADLMAELLNKDRLDYIGIINDSEGGIKSIDVTKKILELRGEKNPEKVRKENIKVNKRLRKLVSYGVLISEDGLYSISSLGYLLMDSWKELAENKKIMDKYREFFDTHFVNDLPREFFCRIHKLKNAEMTQNSIQWNNEVRKYMKRIERKFYNLTEYIHDFPEEIIRKRETGEIEEIVVIYEFMKYPMLNYDDEKKELLERLDEAGAELRYIELENRHPIGIRTVDEKWTTFGLTRTLDGQLDRDKTFIGTDLDFISWCRELMYHMWHFEAQRLDVDKIKGKVEDE